MSRGSSGAHGRFAPSPTGPLHLGNLRTALASWLLSRSAGPSLDGSWVVRMEDLDRVTSSREHEAAQLRSLEALGLVWDGEVVRQSDRFERYHGAIDQLRALGRVYECFCTRREIREAAQAPQAPPGAGELPEGAYPGTCRSLAAHVRARLVSEGRRPALRLRSDGERLAFDDAVAGRFEGSVDDVVLQRNDGVPAYNLAVVVDDAAQGITEVVRGDDLLGSTPRQLLLQQLLGLPHPTYAHVPLVLGPDGTRLAKRHGSVTLEQLEARGMGPPEVLAVLARSLGMEAGAGATAAELATTFDIRAVPREPWTVPAVLLGGSA